MSWIDGILLAPYVGLYGDYYFTEDNATLPQFSGAPPLASVPLLDGWSARVTGGINARFAAGPVLGVGGEYGGLGGNTRVWTMTAKARVPFGAQ